ncbi:hypothetical protein AVEN_24691-1 [Araneus ventricosus]|uniref:Uncharacterized protein n=1 Tax=Araneus ventricosus TaxID=182803 RepID=A0A4Y2SUJ2_ARAVE|nr:hypothetical protein AVEN_126337-1 [Araneus ventricosus]GBN91985.1 hypothetical protein AVEN_24691-1 [Araneus ventricosus]
MHTMHFRPNWRISAPGASASQKYSTGQLSSRKKLSLVGDSALQENSPRQGKGANEALNWERCAAIGVVVLPSGDVAEDGIDLIFLVLPSISGTEGCCVFFVRESPLQRRDRAGTFRFRAEDPNH